MNTAFVLGTAQLGMHYGIANKAGQISKARALALLDRAYQRGVTLWDTAPAYGRSEQYIGAYQTGSPAVCTKLPSVNSRLGRKASRGDIGEFVHAQLASSRKRLRKHCLDYYLLHDEQDLNVYGEKILAPLQNCKRQGQIKKIGVSVYTPSVARAALDRTELDALQVPLNLFDRRFADAAKQAEKKGVTIFARSVFLQGLFFLNPDEAEQKVPRAGKPIQMLRAIAREADRSVASLATCYARDVPGVSSIVIGVETVSQLEDNVRLLETPALSSSLQERIEHHFASLPLSVVNPARWGV